MEQLPLPLDTGSRYIIQAAGQRQGGVALWVEFHGRSELWAEVAKNHPLVAGLPSTDSIDVVIHATWQLKPGWCAGQTTLSVYEWGLGFECPFFHVSDPQKTIGKASATVLLGTLDDFLAIQDDLLTSGDNIYEPCPSVDLMPDTEAEQAALNKHAWVDLAQLRLHQFVEAHHRHQAEQDSPCTKPSL